MKSKSKKLFAVIATVALVAILSVCLVACGGDKGTNKPLLFGKELVKYQAQIDVLTQLNTGSCDIGVIDGIMAGYYMSQDTSMSSTLQLIPDMSFAKEEYGIGAWKTNKALMSKINEGLIATYHSGKMAAIGTKYGLTDKSLVNDDTSNPLTCATDNSWDDLISSANKKLIIGYTEFAPIAYKQDGKLIGYDVELAEAVVDYLNKTYKTTISIDWLPISWSQKETLLENGGIHLVWNGMTLSSEVKANMAVSVPYLENEQVGIIRKADASKYSDISSFLKNARNAIVGVENGSAAASLLLME